MTFIQDMLSDVTNMSGYDLGTTWLWGGGRLPPGSGDKRPDASITYTKQLRGGKAMSWYQVTVSDHWDQRTRVKPGRLLS